MHGAMQRKNSFKVKTWTEARRRTNLKSRFLDSAQICCTNFGWGRFVGSREVGILNLSTPYRFSESKFEMGTFRG